ncbi:MAG: DUF4823 domain-containing protein [Agarilytica sp.]
MPVNEHPQCYRVQKVLLWGFIALLSACTHQYVSHVSSDTLEKAYLKSKFSVDRNREWLVDVNTPIALAPAVHIQGRSMPRNVSALNAGLDITFRQLFADFQLIENNSTHVKPTTRLDVLLQSARELKRDLLFVPSILLVEDRLNTQQELMEGQELHPDKDYGLDRVVFQVLIYEVRTGKIMDTALVTSRSRFFASNKSVPQDLYRKASVTFLNKFTGKTAQ